MYFNVNFNAFFKLIKVHLLVSELYKCIATVRIFLKQFVFGLYSCKVKTLFCRQAQIHDFTLSHKLYYTWYPYSSFFIVFLCRTHTDWSVGPGWQNFSKLFSTLPCIETNTTTTRSCTFITICIL